jgi:hypothetical protein
MKMGRLATVVLLLAGIVVLGASASAQTRPAEKVDVKILYAGHPGSEREKDFVEFLKQHFKEVRTGDLAKFNGSTTGFDVALLDYDGDGFKAPHPALGRDYSRATVTIGVPGGMICSQLSLKTGYM